MSKRTIKIILWICISLLSFQFLAAGATKLMGSWSASFAEWGYPMIFMHAVGLAEIIGVAGLFLSMTRKWSAMLLIAIMIGAAWTHVANQEYSRLIHNGIVVGVAVLVVRLDQKSRIGT